MSVRIEARWLVPLGIALGMLLGAPAHAALPQGAEAPESLLDGGPVGGPLSGLAHVPSAELAQWRGGWTGEDGVMVRFGFEHRVTVNGETQGSFRLDAVDLPLGTARARDVAADLAEAFHVTAHEGVAMHLSDRGMELTLQNSLDGQLIQVLQRLDVQLEGVPTERLGRLSEMMQARMIESLR